VAGAFRSTKCGFFVRAPPYLSPGWEAFQVGTQQQALIFCDAHVVRHYPLPEIHRVGRAGACIWSLVWWPPGCCRATCPFRIPVTIIRLCLPASARIQDGLGTEVYQESYRFCFYTTSGFPDVDYWIMALFIRLIIYTFQLVFSIEIVFFSHNKSVNSVFQPAYQHS
jgi:hypothetical protein